MNKRKNKLKITIAFLLFLFLLIVIFYYLFSKNGKKEIVILEAEYIIAKKKPLDPGGIVLPNSDSLIYEQLQNKKNKKARKIKLVEDPEEPMEIFTPSAYDSIENILENIEYYENMLLKEDSTVAEDIDNIQPNIIKKIEDKKQDKNDTEIVEGLEFNIKKVDRKNTDLKSNEVKEGYQLLLTSAYSMADAKEKWQNIKNKHEDLLSTGNVIIERKESNRGTIFYLITVGYYNSLEQANFICKKLNSKKQSCVVKSLNSY